MMIRGTAYWAKIVGKPVKAYNAGEFEWSIDVALDANGVKTLKDLGCGWQIKNKGDERGDFITFKRKSVTRDGEPAKPIRIVDNKGKLWGTELIGNGSTVNVKFAVNEIPQVGGKLRPKASVIAVQIWEHVPYEGKDDFPVNEDGSESWDEE